jgi:hypothetical protein
MFSECKVKAQFTKQASMSGGRLEVEPDKAVAVFATATNVIPGN